MDFFEHQELARKTSRRLVLHFLLAVLIIAAAVNLVALVIWAISTTPEFQSTSELLAQWQLSPLSWQVPICTIAFITTISFFSWLGLKDGGPAVAKMMGAQAIPSNSAEYQQLINIVTEMSLASGTPVPATYVMKREASMNAFAAGYSPNEAIICVTQGLLDHLNRDELQAVIGHEFSHILNGDIRLNIKLLSVLSGIIAIGQLGAWLMDNSRSRSTYRTAGQHAANTQHGAGIYIGVIGLCLWLVGSIGVFISRLIKSAVSRQREYLADASSVQFTRSSLFLASALDKINHHQARGRLNHRHAEDLSHMCFVSPTLNNISPHKSFTAQASALRSTTLNRLLATHPTINERIHRVAPTYLLKSKAQKASQTIEKSYPADTLVSSTSTVVYKSVDEPLPAIDYQPIQPDTPQSHLIEHALSNMANPSTEGLAHATNVLSQLPDAVITSLREKDFIDAVILGLMVKATGHGETLLDSDLLTNHLLDATTQVGSTFKAPLIKSYFNEFVKLSELPVYPMLAIAIPTLKQLPNHHKAQLLKTMAAIIQQDNQVLPDELFIYLVVFRHLNPKATRQPSIRYRTYKAVRDELSNLFSYLIQLTLAHKDNKMMGSNTVSSSKLQQHFKQISIGFCNHIQWIPIQRISSNQLATAILRLEHLPPLLKKPLLPACYDLMMWNQSINHQENDWIRMLADCWDCPLPALEQHIL